MNLTELAIKHNTDKAWHGYTQYYDRHFADLRDSPVLLLEIGVASGASMRMWDEYFTSPNAMLFGVDIDPECKPDKEISSRTQILIADGTKLPYEGDKFDIIIDDGSHTSDDIIKAIEHWWKHLESGGWYVIEDLAVQWRNDYGGGDLGSPATDSLKKIVDQIWQKDTDNVTEFHAYDEIVFLRKT